MPAIATEIPAVILQRKRDPPREAHQRVCFTQSTVLSSIPRFYHAIRALVVATLSHHVTVTYRLTALACVSVAIVQPERAIIPQHSPDLTTDRHDVGKVLGKRRLKTDSRRRLHRTA